MRTVSSYGEAWNILPLSVRRLTLFVGVPAWLTFGYWIVFDTGSASPPDYAIVGFVVFAIVAMVQMIALGIAGRSKRNG